MLVSIQQLQTLSSDDIKEVMGKLQNLWIYWAKQETLSYDQRERKAKLEEAIHNCDIVLNDRH